MSTPACPRGIFLLLSLVRNGLWLREELQHRNSCWPRQSLLDLISVLVRAPQWKCILGMCLTAEFGVVQDKEDKLKALESLGYKEVFVQHTESMFYRYAISAYIPFFKRA